MSANIVAARARRIVPFTVFRDFDTQIIIIRSGYIINQDYREYASPTCLYIIGFILLRNIEPSCIQEGCGNCEVIILLRKVK